MVTDRLTEIAVQLAALDAADFDDLNADAAGMERLYAITGEPAAAEARQFLAYQRSLGAGAPYPEAAD